MIDAPVGLAFAAGLVATVNPCGFAMLPAYLSYFMGLEGDDDEPDTKRDGGVGAALRVGGTVSLGFLLVFGVTDYVSRDLTLHYGAVAAKAPTGEAEQAACRLLGKRLAEWTATLVHGVAAEHPGGKLAHRRPAHG